MTGLTSAGKAILMNGASWTAVKSIIIPSGGGGGDPGQVLVPDSPTPALLDGYAPGIYYPDTVYLSPTDGYQRVLASGFARLETSGPQVWTLSGQTSGFLLGGPSGSTLQSTIGTALGNTTATSFALTITVTDGITTKTKNITVQNHTNIVYSGTNVGLHNDPSSYYGNWKLGPGTCEFGWAGGSVAVTDQAGLLAYDGGSNCMVMLASMGSRTTHYGQHDAAYTVSGGATYVQPYRYWMVQERPADIRMDQAGGSSATPVGSMFATVRLFSDSGISTIALVGDDGTLALTWNSDFRSAQLRVKAPMTAGTNKKLTIRTVSTNGLVTDRQFSYDVALGVTLPSSAMTMTVPTTIDNYAIGQTVGTPVVTGIPGTKVWTLKYGDDQEPTMPLFAINSATGLITAPGQLSNRVHHLTVGCSDGSTFCTKTFDLSVIWHAGPTYHVGQGMAAAHPGFGFEHMYQLMGMFMQTVDTVAAGATILVYHNADPDYFSNDNGSNPQDFGLRYGWDGPVYIKSADLNGPRPRMGGFINSYNTGADMGGKGFFNVANGDFVIEGIEISYVNGPDDTHGVSAIRKNAFVYGDLTVKNCHIHNTNNGIESGTGPYIVSVFNTTMDNLGDVYVSSGATHGIYAGDHTSLVFQNNLVYNVANGHCVKTRAYAGTITGCRLYDGERGSASSQIDIPNGGDYIINNNDIQKGPNATNPYLIQYGEEQCRPGRVLTLSAQGNRFGLNLTTGTHFGDAVAFGMAGDYSTVNGAISQAILTNNQMWQGTGSFYANHGYPFGHAISVKAESGTTTLSQMFALDFTDPGTASPGAARAGFYNYINPAVDSYNNFSMVQIDAGTEDIRVAASAAIGTVIGTCTAHGADYWKGQGNVNDPRVQPFGAGSVWSITQDPQFYGSGPWWAPVGRYSITSTDNGVTALLKVNAALVAGLDYVKVRVVGPTGTTCDHRFYVVCTTAVAGPVLVTSGVSGLVPAQTSTVNGLFSNGAPTGVTATSDGATLTLSSLVISTTSGSGNTAAGTWSANFVTPGAGNHVLVAQGTGTYAGTAAGYTYAVTAPVTALVTLISPAFFLSPTGNDSADGSIGTPFLTFQRAQSAMRGSTTTRTTYLRAGVYLGYPILSLDQNDVNCKWMGYPGEVPIIDGQGNISNPITLSFNSSGITIDHLTIRNCRESGIYLHGGSGVPVNGNTISNNTIYNVTVANLSQGAGRSGGIWLDNFCTNNIIRNNDIHDTACVGIALATGTSAESVVGTQILYNRITRCNNTGQHDTGGIYILDRAHNVNNIVIEGNWIEDPSPTAGAPGVNSNNVKAIYLDDEASWVTVRNNVVTGKCEMGFQLHGGNNCVFENNIFDVHQATLLSLYQADPEFGNFGMGANTFQKNIVWSNATYNGNVGELGQPGLWTVLNGGVSIANPACSNNVYYNTAAPFPLSGDVVDPNPHVVNPNFTNAPSKIFTFTDAGAAVSAACGFVPIDFTLLGPVAQAIGTPAAVLSGISTTSSVGGNITGTITLSYITTAYAALWVSGAQEGARVGFSGNTVPNTLHPGTTGTYTLRVYTLASGGTLLATSPSITVTGAVPLAYLSNVSTNVTTGGTIFGTVQLVNIVTAYAALWSGGSQIGSRVAFTGTSLPAISPAAVGTDTIRIYDLATAGTMLAESPPITVTAPGALISPAFFVSTTGNDSNVGSAASPFLTLEKARTAMRAGATKTTYFRGGTYNRTLRFELTALDNNTSWLGYPAEVPIIDGGNAVTDIFWLDYHSANIKIDHLKITNAVICCIHLNGWQQPGDDGTITGCTITNNTLTNVTQGGTTGAGNTGAVRLSFATRGNTIANNLITDTAGPGISIVAGGSNEWAIGNHVVRNKVLRTNNTGQNDTGGIYWLDRGHNGDVNNPTIIDGNYIENVGTGVDTKHIYLDDEVSCVTIRNNICCGASHYGFQLHGGDHIAMTNNIFDLTVADRYLCLYQDATGAGWPNYQMGSNTFSANIIYSGGTYSQSQMWQYLNQSGGTLTKPAVSNNLYFQTAGTLPNTGDIIDTSPQVSNPLFTNAAAHDYSFTAMTGANLIGFSPINQALIGPQ